MGRYVDVIRLADSKRLTLPGPTYRSAEVFDLSTMEPYTLGKLHSDLGLATSNLVLYLPRTSDLRQLAELVEPGKKMSVVHYCTDGGSRALCAYIGSGWTSKG
jgi:trimethylguanosine synthase